MSTTLFLVVMGAAGWLREPVEARPLIRNSIPKSEATRSRDNQRGVRLPPPAHFSHKPTTQVPSGEKSVIHHIAGWIYTSADN